MGRTISIKGALPLFRSDPEGAEVRGVVIVIHEVWGLVDHIRNVADRLAGEGYIALAPDILSSAGITPQLGAELERLAFGDERTRADAQPMLRQKLAPSRAPDYAMWAVDALRDVVDSAAEMPGIDGRIAVTGFCFGGGYRFALAAADSRVKAAIAFYGYPPASTAVAAIECPVLAFYGDRDSQLMASLPGLTATMAAAAVDFTPRVYRGAGHAFFNDTNVVTYDAQAASDAWTRMLRFLAHTLEDQR